MSYTCPRCGRTSHHPKDEEHRYCGACHKFEGDPMTPMEKLQAVKLEMGQRGWTHGGSPPEAVKRDLSNRTLAVTGSDEWLQDVQACIETVEAREAMIELRRRYPDEGSPRPRVAEAFVDPLNAGVSG